MKTDALENNDKSREQAHQKFALNSHYHRGGSGIGLATPGSPPSTTRRSRCCRDEGCRAKAPSTGPKNRRHLVQTIGGRPATTLEAFIDKHRTTFA
jgi:hypothetical protein